MQNPYTGLTLPDGTVVAEENFMLAPLDERANSLSEGGPLPSRVGLPGLKSPMRLSRLEGYVRTWLSW